MSITHTFVSAKADSADTSLINPSNWNAAHTITQILTAKGADIASAAALTLGTDGNYFHVTGTTTITSISTLAAGAIIVLEFDGALTLTYNATSLILRGNINVTTAAGDMFIFVSEGSGNWREVARLIRALGTPSTQASADSPAAGTGSQWANIDHKHGMPTIGSGWDFDAPTTAAASQQVAFFLPFPGQDITGWYFATDGTSTYNRDATTGRVFIRLLGNTTLGATRYVILNFGGTTQLRAAENPSFKCFVRQQQAPVGGTVDLYMGFRADLTTGQSDGIYLRMTDTGNVFLVCRNGGVETTATLSEAVTGTLKEFEIRVTGDGTSVQGYVNGVATGSAITTNIPTALMRIACFLDNRAITITTGAQYDCYWGMGIKVDIVA